MNKGFTKEDRLMADIMKDFRLEDPSEGFTDRVMQSVAEVKKAPAVSRPLIGRGGWIGIGLGLTALILYLFLSPGSAASGGSETLPFKLPALSLPEGFRFSAWIDRFNFDSPALVWIFTAIGILILLAFLDRAIIGLRERYLVHRSGILGE